MTLFTIFAAVALLLAATGLYSVVSYTVAQRTHEFGIRMALGAQRRHVLQLVGASTMALLGVGAVIGLAGSLALSSVISGFIEGWNSRDPVAYVTVAAVLLCTGLLACAWVPRAPRDCIPSIQWPPSGENESAPGSDLSRSRRERSAASQPSEGGRARWL